MNEPKHCDDYIDDETQPAPLRKFLEHARAPGHGYGLGSKPLLFATVACPHEAAREHVQQFGGRDGQRVRVNMASRMGDVGITDILDKEFGYCVRVPLEWLKDFSDEQPTPIRSKS